MKVRTSELSGFALDWAVAKIEEVEYQEEDYRQEIPFYYEKESTRFSSNWAQGGPIIEREGLCVGRKHQCDSAYCELNDPAVNHWARTPSGGFLSYGPTPLIAAMRCYVASKLGDVVDVPDELTT